MNRFKLILLITGAALIFTSCDPLKTITIKNKTEKPAYFRWTLRADSSDISSEQKSKTTTFDLGTNREDNKKIIVLGFGNWSASEVERFVNENIQSIEIQSVREKRVMTDKREIMDYLLTRRHGVIRNSILIKLK